MPPKKHNLRNSTNVSKAIPSSSSSKREASGSPTPTQENPAPLKKKRSVASVKPLSGFTPSTYPDCTKYHVLYDQSLEKGYVDNERKINVGLSISDTRVKPQLFAMLLNKPGNSRDDVTAVLGPGKGIFVSQVSIPIHLCAFCMIS